MKGERKTVVVRAFMVRILIEGEPRIKGYQRRGKSKRRGDLIDKECYDCMKKGHTQMMYKEMK